VGYSVEEEHTASLFRIVGLELGYNLVTPVGELGYNLVTPVGYKEGGHNQKLIFEVCICVHNVCTALLSFCIKM